MKDRYGVIRHLLAITGMICAALSVSCTSPSPNPSDLTAAQSQVGKTFTGTIVVNLCPAPQLPVDRNCTTVSPKSVTVLGIVPYRNVVFARVRTNVGSEGVILFDPISIGQLARADDRVKSEAFYDEWHRYCAAAFSRLHIGMRATEAGKLNNFRDKGVCATTRSTTTAEGVFEQWGWGDSRFAYFRNGVLVAIQR